MRMIQMIDNNDSDNQVSIVPDDDNASEHSTIFWMFKNTIIEFI